MADLPDRDEYIRRRRVQYETDGLDVADVDPDPMEQWHRWHADAVAADVAEPNAMTVATVAEDGGADARVVLVRGVDATGLLFFTNYDSVKSRQLARHPHAAGTFAWLDLHRQVRVRANVERSSDEESDAYFASRPRASQLSSWASPQSQVLADRAELEALVVGFDEQFSDGPVPRPPHWGGWRLVPFVWEFWQGRPNRMHDRLRYRREGGAWLIERLGP